MAGLALCGCGQPLWAEASRERGFCEYCRRHHCSHWPETGHRPRALPYPFPGGGYSNPYHRADDKPREGLHLVGNVIHRHTCIILTGQQVAWPWADTVTFGEMLWAAAYLGYRQCPLCHPEVSLR